MHRIALGIGTYITVIDVSYSPTMVTVFKSSSVNVMCDSPRSQRVQHLPLVLFVMILVTLGPRLGPRMRCVRARRYTKIRELARQPSGCGGISARTWQWQWLVRQRSSSSMIAVVSTHIGVDAEAARASREWTFERYWESLARTI